MSLTSPARRAIARSRAISSSISNGLVTQIRRTRKASAIRLGQPGMARAAYSPAVPAQLLALPLAEGPVQGQFPVPERPGTQTLPGQDGRRHGDDRAARMRNTVTAHPATS